MICMLLLIMLSSVAWPRRLSANLAPNEKILSDRTVSPEVLMTICQDRTVSPEVPAKELFQREFVGQNCPIPNGSSCQRILQRQFVRTELFLPETSLERILQRTSWNIAGENGKRVRALGTMPRMIFDLRRSLHSLELVDVQARG